MVFSKKEIAILKKIQFFANNFEKLEQKTGTTEVVPVQLDGGIAQITEP